MCQTRDSKVSDPGTHLKLQGCAKIVANAAKGQCSFELESEVSLDHKKQAIAKASTFSINCCRRSTGLCFLHG